MKRSVWLLLTVGLSVGCAQSKDYKDLKVNSLYGSYNMAEDGSFIVPENVRWVDASYLVVAKKDGDEKTRLMGFVFPGESKVKLDERSTALSLVIVNPIFGWIDPKSRHVLAQYAYEHPKFSELSSLVSNYIEMEEDVINPNTVALAAGIADDIYKRIFGYNPSQEAEKLRAIINQFDYHKIRPEGLLDFLNSAWKAIKSFVRNVLDEFKDWLRSIGASLLCWPEPDSEPWIESAGYGKVAFKNPRHIYYGSDFCKRVGDGQSYDCIRTQNGQADSIIVLAKGSSLDISIWPPRISCSDAKATPEYSLPNPSEHWRMITFKGYERDLGFLPSNSGQNDCLFNVCGRGLGSGDGTVWGSRPPRLAFLANTLKIIKMIIALFASDPLPDAARLAYAIEFAMNPQDVQYLERALYTADLNEIIGTGISFFSLFKGTLTNLITGNCSFCDAAASSSVLSSVGQLLGDLAIVGKIYAAFTSYIPFILDLIDAPAHAIVWAKNGYPIPPIPEVFYIVGWDSGRPGLLMYIGGFYPSSQGSIKMKILNTGQVRSLQIAYWPSTASWGEAGFYVPTDISPLPANTVVWIESQGIKSTELPLNVSEWSNTQQQKGPACKPDPKTGECKPGDMGGGGCDVTLSKTSSFSYWFILLLVPAAVILVSKRMWR